MKKFFLFTIFVLAHTFSVHAEEEGDFFDNLIVDDELKQKVEENLAKEKAQFEAGEILDRKPIQLKIDENATLKMDETKVEEIVPVARQIGPFGLKWLATKKEIEDQGVKLTMHMVKDAPNSFVAENLPKPLKAMRQVIVSFGDNDSLWRISGVGALIDDDGKASKGISEYKKFFDLLDQKYGNGEEFYTPYVANVEETVQADDGTSSKTIKQLFMQIGDEGFKSRLMSGEATLYATFSNDRVSATLALLADGNGQTYIVIDYTNLDAEAHVREEILDAL